VKALLKNKKFISSILTVVLIGIGAANPKEAAELGGNIYCNVLVKCDA
jgi:hypothetical protein